VEYNRLLKRQIRRHLKGAPEIPEEFLPLLKAISDSFDHYEADRNMIERSLEISSKELNTMNEKVRDALSQIEEKNKSIMDSINYAKRIQEAILPSEEMVKELLGDAFVLFRPKDIVSGDFYWITGAEDKVIFTASDCTGHGVPGAFMSMISSALLTETTVEKGITAPHEILNEVRKGIITALKQTGIEGEQRDGFDSAICLFDKKTLEMSYAGANNSMFLIRNSQLPVRDLLQEENLSPTLIAEDGARLYEIKGNRQPVALQMNMTEFTPKKIKVTSGDSIYITSDGYPDQFGGERGKKYMSKRFKNLLCTIHGHSMAEQKRLLDKEMNDWMGGAYEQVDDICVIGSRIK
jgi:serine phosphatase RsbU (regulator of sigma subunit)